MDAPSPITVLTGHEDAVLCLKITSDGKKIISSSRDKTIRIWDSPTKTVVKLMGHEDYISSLALTLDNKYLFSGSKDKKKYFGIWKQEPK